eukprot:TRINITY_DN2794_c0_g2_i1.p1 TRINITY_DN2794_c0_g2~~TRINITY_DN2794_c0_g2_i1.p1  ORF type:complete len:1132 (+),score=153.97 TRINITY_DN2794_c0_g2_i1:405-3800(+)
MDAESQSYGIVSVDSPCVQIDVQGKDGDTISRSSITVGHSTVPVTFNHIQSKNTELECSSNAAISLPCQYSVHIGSDALASLEGDDDLLGDRRVPVDSCACVLSCPLSMSSKCANEQMVDASPDVAAENCSATSCKQNVSANFSCRRCNSLACPEDSELLGSKQTEQAASEAGGGNDDFQAIDAFEADKAELGFEAEESLCRSSTEGTFFCTAGDKGTGGSGAGSNDHGSVLPVASGQSELAPDEADSLSGPSQAIPLNSTFESDFPHAYSINGAKLGLEFGEISSGLSAEDKVEESPLCTAGEKGPVVSALERDGPGSVLSVASEQECYACLEASTRGEASCERATEGLCQSSRDSEHSARSEATLDGQADINSEKLDTGSHGVPVHVLIFQGLNAGMSSGYDAGRAVYARILGASNRGVVERSSISGRDRSPVAAPDVVLSLDLPIWFEKDAEFLDFMCPEEGQCIDDRKYKVDCRVMNACVGDNSSGGVVCEGSNAASEAAVQAGIAGVAPVGRLLVSNVAGSLAALLPSRVFSASSTPSVSHLVFGVSSQGTWWPRGAATGAERSGTAEAATAAGKGGARAECSQCTTAEGKIIAETEVMQTHGAGRPMESLKAGTIPEMAAETSPPANAAEKAFSGEKVQVELTVMISGSTTPRSGTKVQIEDCAREAKLQGAVIEFDRVAGAKPTSGSSICQMTSRIGTSSEAGDELVDLDAVLAEPSAEELCSLSRRSELFIPFTCTCGEAHVLSRIARGPSPIPVPQLLSKLGPCETSTKASVKAAGKTQVSLSTGGSSFWSVSSRIWPTSEDTMHELCLSEGSSQSKAQRSAFTCPELLATLTTCGFGLNRRYLRACGPASQSTSTSAWLMQLPASCLSTIKKQSFEALLSPSLFAAQRRPDGKCLIDEEFDDAVIILHSFEEGDALEKQRRRSRVVMIGLLSSIVGATAGSMLGGSVMVPLVTTCVGVELGSTAAASLGALAGAGLATTVAAGSAQLDIAQLTPPDWHWRTAAASAAIRREEQRLAEELRLEEEEVQEGSGHRRSGALGTLRGNGEGERDGGVADDFFCVEKADLDDAEAMWTYEPPLPLSRWPEWASKPTFGAADLTVEGVRGEETRSRGWGWWGRVHIS